MKLTHFSIAATGAAMLFAVGMPTLGAPSLTERILDTDGAANTAGFNATTGLGSISVTISGAGLKKSYFYVDHELSAASNTFFNENGTTGPGSLPAGLSFEIDEPGFASAPDGPGDIYSNFGARTLDNAAFKVGATTLPTPNDVAMAFGWDFTLLADEVAYISYIVAQNIQAVGSSYYLIQSDPDSQETLYFATSLDIRKLTGEVPIPEGRTIWGAGAAFGLIGAAAWRRRRRAA